MIDLDCIIYFEYMQSHEQFFSSFDFVADTSHGRKHLNYPNLRSVAMSVYEHTRQGHTLLTVFVFGLFLRSSRCKSSFVSGLKAIALVVAAPSFLSFTHVELSLVLLPIMPSSTISPPQDFLCPFLALFSLSFFQASLAYASFTIRSYRSFSSHLASVITSSYYGCFFSCQRRLEQRCE